MPLFAKAMEMFETIITPDRRTPLENLAPSKVLQLLEQMLAATVLDPSKSSKSKIKLTQRQVNSINGCLLRVPDNFYPSVYKILKRCPGGLTFMKKHLPQKTTLKMMEAYELNFFHTVESFLVQYVEPDKRFLMIRVLVILSTILNRNPELTYRKELIMDNLITDSLKLYLKDKNLLSEGSFEDLNLFGLLDLDAALLDSYIARSIVNLLLGAEIGEQEMECKLQ